MRVLHERHDVNDCLRCTIRPPIITGLVISEKAYVKLMMNSAQRRRWELWPLSREKGRRSAEGRTHTMPKNRTQPPRTTPPPTTHQQPSVTPNNRQDGKPCVLLSRTKSAPEENLHIAIIQIACSMIRHPSLVSISTAQLSPPRRSTNVSTLVFCCFVKLKHVAALQIPGIDGLATAFYYQITHPRA